MSERVAQTFSEGRAPRGLVACLLEIGPRGARPSDLFGLGSLGQHARLENPSPKNGEITAFNRPRSRRRPRPRSSR